MNEQRQKNATVQWKHVRANDVLDLDQLVWHGDTENDDGTVVVAYAQYVCETRDRVLNYKRVVDLTRRAASPLRCHYALRVEGGEAR